MFRPNEKHHQQDVFGLQSQLPAHAWKLLTESSEYAFYNEVFCRIPEAVFADLYDDSPATRPNVPVNRLVGALILQHVKDWTFEELLGQLALDLKARAALGLWTLDEEAFCRATLFNFLRRLRDHMVNTGQDKFQVVFDRMSEEQLERFGLKSTIQRCDTTQMGSNIRVFTRIELLVEVVLRMWRVLGEADQAKHRERFAPYVDAKTSGQFLYRLRKSDHEATLVRLGEFYAWMADALKAEYGSKEIFGIVCRLFAEQFSRVEEKVAVRAPEEIRSDSLQSPDDLDATHRKKDGESFQGFVLHATETADPENPLQLITDVVVEPNNRDDSRICATASCARAACTRPPATASCARSGSTLAGSTATSGSLRRPRANRLPHAPPHPVSLPSRSVPPGCCSACAASSGAFRPPESRCSAR